MKVLRRFRKDEKGAAMVEFAIVAGLVFIPLMFGVIEFGRLIWAKNMVTSAAREGVRYAIVHGSSSGATFDSAAVANYVIGRTQISPIKVSTTWTGAKDPQDTVRVTVRYDYVPVVKVPGLVTTKTVTGVSQQIIAF
jgi:Flp pilus assembly protein TadG